MQEYIVTLHNREDLDDFYNDMETPGGDLYIPDRAVDLELRRSISRNTHYMLTPEEVIELKNDPRVLGVESKAFLDLLQCELNGYSDTGPFKRNGDSISATDKNWGLYRHVIGTNALSGEWGDDGTATITPGTNTITASGKNVDVLIVDGHITTTAQAHPEFAVNADGTGGSRVQAFNWFSLANQLGLGPNATYNYGTMGNETDTNHGVHVAGTVAGNTQGWAREANIYNIEAPVSSATNHGYSGLQSGTMWDYIREWHNTKTINAETGRRNPTISNHSYGFTISKDIYISGPANGYAGYDGIGQFKYRGVTFDKYGDEGSDLTNAELEARGINVQADGNWIIPYAGISWGADIADAIADGIIIVTSAGNSYQKTVKSGDQDYENYIYFRSGSDTSAFAAPSHRSSSIGLEAATLNVGSLDSFKNDRKNDFSVCGNAVDIFAAGAGIVSSTLTGSFGGVQDSRNGSYYLSKIGGTSMAAPQVAGVIALLAESNPNITQADANAWIEANATTSEMFDSGTDSSTDFGSLQGAPNKILMWKNQRPETGMSFPKVNAKARPTSGLAYPRPRIRKRG